jgi:hypothetical protein
MNKKRQKCFFRKHKTLQKMTRTIAIDLDFASACHPGASWANPAKTAHRVEGERKSTKKNKGLPVFF